MPVDEPAYRMYIRRIPVDRRPGLSARGEYARRAHTQIGFRRLLLQEFTKAANGRARVQNKVLVRDRNGSAGSSKFEGEL